MEVGSLELFHLKNDHDTTTIRKVHCRPLLAREKLLKTSSYAIHELSTNALPARGIALGLETIGAPCELFVTYIFLEKTAHLTPISLCHVEL